MTRSLRDTELAALQQAATVGFSRGFLPVPATVHVADDPSPGLTWLAFAAHQIRLTTAFVRVPASAAPLVAPDDPRPVLPDNARAGLRRLMDAIKLHKAPELAATLARSIREGGWRIHPFDTDLAWDLPEAAGPFDRWVAQRAGLVLPEVGSFDASDADWSRLPLAPRVRWLTERRRRDPDGARVLLEAAWPTEKADQRVQLLPALLERLTTSDQTFLTAVSTDRSPRVREVAQALLARLAEPANANPQSALRGRLAHDPERPGVLRLAEDTNLDEVFARIANWDPQVLLEALGVDEGALRRSAESLAPVLPAFALGALGSGRTSEFQALVAAARRAGWDPNTGPFLTHLTRFHPVLRREALAPLWPDLLQSILHVAEDPSEWAAVLDGPLPPSASQQLRALPGWRALLEASADPAQGKPLRRLAPLIHPADARRAADDLDALGPATAPLVRQFWSWLADLEAMG